MPRLKLLQDYASFKAGDAVEFSRSKAARLIRLGIGEEAKTPKPRKRKTKGAK